MTEDGGRRAKRRCARKYTSTAMPSAIHYVGYVSGSALPRCKLETMAVAAPGWARPKLHR